MLQLNSFINQSLFKAKIYGKVRIAMILSVAEKEINELMPCGYHGHYKVLFIKDKILTLACLDLNVGQEIKDREKDIVKAVNNKFGQEVLEFVSIVPKFS